MKFCDKEIGCILETENPIVIEQFKKYNSRYQEIKKQKNIAEVKSKKD